MPADDLALLADFLHARADLHGDRYFLRTVALGSEGRLLFVLATLLATLLATFLATDRAGAGIWADDADVCLLVSIGDSTTSEVVRSELYLDLVARKDADVVHSHLSADVRQHLVAVFELDAEHGVRQRLGDRALEHDGVVFRLGQRGLLTTDRAGGTTRANSTPGRRKRTRKLNWAEEPCYRADFTTPSPDVECRKQPMSSVSVAVTPPWAPAFPTVASSAEPEEDLPSAFIGSRRGTSPGRRDPRRRLQPRHHHRSIVHRS